MIVLYESLGRVSINIYIQAGCLSFKLNLEILILDIYEEYCGV